MNNFEFSKMTLDHLDALSPILSSEFDDFYSYITFKQELENTHSEYIICKTGEEIVGFAGIWKAVDDVHITNIVVKKNYRGLRYR